MKVTCILAVVAALLVAGGGCGDDDADSLGVGAACTSTDQCNENQTCLTAFKGGYCGIMGCTADVDCPPNSGCVAHTDGTNYCFRICLDKVECNANRPVDVESNCSSNVTFVEGKSNLKACVPPSS